MWQNIIMIMKNDKIKLLLLCGGFSAMFSLVSCGGSNESTEVYYGDGPAEVSNQSVNNNEEIDSTMLGMGDSLAADAENVVPDSAKALDANKSAKASASVSFATPEEAVEYMKNSANWAEYSEGILPQMTEESLSYAQKLINSPYQHFIVVDKERMKVILYDKYGRMEKEYTMACGKNYGTKQGDWDSRTPEGFFSAEGVYNSTEWLFKDKNGRVSPTKGQYGPRFIRLKTPVTSGVGIHGTCSPGALGRRVSHGCIRIKNENILELVQYVEKGMPIIVNPSKKDAAVNESAGYNVSKITTKKISVASSDSVKVVFEPIDTTSVKVDTAKVASKKAKKSKTTKVDTMKISTIAVEKAVADTVK